MMRHQYLNWINFSCIDYERAKICFSDLGEHVQNDLRYSDVVAVKDSFYKVKISDDLIEEVIHRSSTSIFVKQQSSI